MVYVYAISILEKVSQQDYQYLFSLISREKKERLSKFHFVEDVKRSLYADVLVRKISSEQIGIGNHQIEFQNNDYGKPFLKGFPDFHFNISHSGEWVVCAFSDRRVGIDIELIRPVDLKIAQNYYSPREYIDIIQKRFDFQEQYFYLLWTLKESYVKCEGKGLTTPLDSISFYFNGEEINIMPSEGKELLKFKIVEFDKRYILAVSSEEEIISDKVNLLNVKYLLT